MKNIITIILFLSAISSFAQYPPAAGISGSTAIHADSSLIVAWATSCEVTRGWADISDTIMGKVDFGTATDALQKADNIVVSLGDGGSAVVQFDCEVTDGAGADFVVFENSFTDSFLELAFVEVSSDGINYFGFPTHSLTQTEIQVAGFDTLNTELINNLAGKYRVMYGTPFDLSEIHNDPLLNKNLISHIRITDVVGSINPIYASYDSQGNIINDPWPTPFNTGGFDLDAVGAINQACNINTVNIENQGLVYPNPAENEVFVRLIENTAEIKIMNLFGQVVLNTQITANKSIGISQIASGTYIIEITFNNVTTYSKLVKK